MTQKVPKNTHLVFTNRYYHYDEIRIPGSLANIKEKFHHKKAGVDAKVPCDEFEIDLIIFANLTSV